MCLHYRRLHHRRSGHLQELRCEYVVLRHESGECIDIFFDADRPISDVAFTVSAIRNDKITSLFKRIFTVWVSKSDGYTFEAMSLLYRIFAEIAKEKHSPKKHSDKIVPAIDLINNEFLKRDIALGELAAASGMCESYF